MKPKTQLLALLAVTILGFNPVSGARETPGPGVQTTVYTEYINEYEKYASIAGSRPRTLRANALRVGANFLGASYAAGFNVRARRVTGFLGQGFTRADVDAKGSQYRVYGAWRPHPALFVGAAATFEYDSGLLFPIIGSTDATVTSHGVRPFVAAVLPLDDWRLDVILAGELSRTRVAFKGFRPSYSRLYQAFADVDVTVPLDSVFSVRAGARTRYIFREDVTLGGAPRDRLTVEPGLKLSAALSGRDTLSFEASKRLFDSVEDSAEFSLRYSRRY